MKYSDISVSKIKCDHNPMYRLCKRGKINKKNRKFAGVYNNKPSPICEVLNFAFVDGDDIYDLFSEDGEYMLVECKDGDERVILPDELKTLLTREYDNIVSDFHQYDEDDGSMYEPCLEILNAIKDNIK